MNLTQLKIEQFGKRQFGANLNLLFPKVDKRESWLITRVHLGLVVGPYSYLQKSPNNKFSKTHLMLR